MDISVEALLDSGANHSIVGPCLFDQIPSLKQNLKEVKQNLSARAINGTYTTYKQEIHITIIAEGHQYGIKAYYSPVLPYNIILGYNFLKKAKMIINFGKRCVYPQQDHVLKVPKDIYVDPLSEIVIWAKVTGQHIPGLAYLRVIDQLQT